MTEDNKPQDGAAPQGGDTQVFETLKHPNKGARDFSTRLLHVSDRLGLGLSNDYMTSLVNDVFGSPANKNSASVHRNKRRIVTEGIINSLNKIGKISPTAAVKSLNYLTIVFSDLSPKRANQYVGLSTGELSLDDVFSRKERVGLPSEFNPDSFYATAQKGRKPVGQVVHERLYSQQERSFRNRAIGGVSLVAVLAAAGADYGANDAKGMTFIKNKAVAGASSVADYAKEKWIGWTADEKKEVAKGTTTPTTPPPVTNWHTVVANAVEQDRSPAVFADIVNAYICRNGEIAVVGSSEDVMATKLYDRHFGDNKDPNNSRYKNSFVTKVIDSGLLGVDDLGIDGAIYNSGLSCNPEDKK